jgi:hypothetical protein
MLGALANGNKAQCPKRKCEKDLVPTQRLILFKRCVPILLSLSSSSKRARKREVTVKYTIDKARSSEE